MTATAYLVAQRKRARERVRKLEHSVSFLSTTLWTLSQVSQMSEDISIRFFHGLAGGAVGCFAHRRGQTVVKWCPQLVQKWLGEVLGKTSQDHYCQWNAPSHGRLLGQNSRQETRQQQMIDDSIDDSSQLFSESFFIFRYESHVFFLLMHAWSACLLIWLVFVLRQLCWEAARFFDELRILVRFVQPQPEVGDVAAHAEVQKVTRQIRCLTT